MSKRRPQRSRLPIRAEINVTSLVDVAFTLLVIFIITAPVLQGGVDVNVPTGQVGSVEASEDMLIVSLQADGSAFFGETPVPSENLEEALGQVIRAGNLDAVYVKADSLAYWGPVFKVLTTVWRADGVKVYALGREIVP